MIKIRSTPEDTRAAGRDLRAMFALLKLEEGSRAPSHTRLLLQSLAIMAHHQGPAAFFDFGDETAGLMRTMPLKLPGQLAFASNHLDGSCCCPLNQLCLLKKAVLSFGDHACELRWQGITIAAPVFVGEDGLCCIQFLPHF